MTSESSDYRTNNYTVQADADGTFSVLYPDTAVCVFCRGIETRAKAEEIARRHSTQSRCESSNY